MAAKLSEGLGEQVTCPVCLERYSDPRLLPCLHTYCRKCLQDLLAKGERKASVVCPECREEVQITSGDVTKLKVNFWINNLLSLLAIHSTDDKDGGKTERFVQSQDSLPDPKQCLVTQSINGRFVPNRGPITATHGQVLNFVICVSNVFGDKLRFMEDRIEVRVSGTPLNSKTRRYRTRDRRARPGMFLAAGPDGLLVAQPIPFSTFGGTSSAQPKSSDGITQIQCHEDNTYSFDFCIDGLSKAEIDVKLDGIQIQGCPFRITYGTETGINQNNVIYSGRQ